MEPLAARRVHDGGKNVQPRESVCADASMHTCHLGFFLHFLALEYIKTMILQATFYTKEVDYVMKLTMAAYGAH